MRLLVCWWYTVFIDGLFIFFSFFLRERLQNSRIYPDSEDEKGSKKKTKNTSTVEVYVL